MEMKTQTQNGVSSTSTVDLQLQEEFMLGALKFANNPLHKKLSGDAQVIDKLKFVPRMLFFVLGFKDLMQMVRYEDPQTDLEKSVNIHSDEDSFHWEWYLKDLTYISGWFKNSEVSDVISGVWDSDTYEVRKTIYMFSKYIQEYTDPVARMLMIEVLEMTFDKFKEALHPILKDADLYDQLKYFGKAHQETEENHTTGISDDEIIGLINKLPEGLKQQMIKIVNELFDQMYKMASNWAEAA